MSVASEYVKKYRKKWPHKRNGHRKRNPDKRKEYRTRNYQQSEGNNWNVGEPWSAEDLKLIMAKNRPKGQELSKLLGRPVQNINRKRAKIVAQKKSKKKLSRKKKP